jgi:hypothetical protein
MVPEFEISVTTLLVIGSVRLLAVLIGHRRAVRSR